MKVGHSAEMERGDFGVAVSGQIGEDERGAGFNLVAGAFMKGEEVDGAGAARCG